MVLGEKRFCNFVPVNIKWWMAKNCLVLHSLHNSRKHPNQTKPVKIKILRGCYLTGVWWDRDARPVKHQKCKTQKHSWNQPFCFAVPKILCYLEFWVLCTVIYIKMCLRKSLRSTEHSNLTDMEILFQIVPNLEFLLNCQFSS